MYRFILSALVLFSFQLKAFDFSEADRLYAQRDRTQRDAIQKARALYEKALDSSLLRDKLYALDHLGHLAFFEGDLLTSAKDKTTRERIFNQCYGYTRKVLPGAVGETPEFYHWTAACLALWGEAANPLVVMGRLGELKDTLLKGLRQFPNFDHGAFQRVAGAIYFKSNFRTFVWLYDPAKAMQSLNESIKQGPDYYLSHRIKAELLLATDRKKEALQFLEQTKSEMKAKAASRSIPKEILPETKILYAHIVSLLEHEVIVDPIAVN